jgi:hypothetical protein
LDEEYVNSSSISSQKSEREALGFRHGEESGSDDRRLE